MKQKTLLALFLPLLFIALIACSGAVKGKAGMGSMALLKAMPGDLPMIFWADTAKAFTMEMFNKNLSQKTENKPSTDKFEALMAKAGIDPKKDLYGVLAGASGAPDDKNMQALVLLNLKYDPERLKKAIREESTEKPQETSYNGKTLFLIKDTSPSEDKGEKPLIALALMDPWILAVGSENRVKQAIDLSKGKGASAAKEARFKPYLAKIDPKSVFWGVALWEKIPLPKELSAAKAPQDFNLSSLKGVYGFVDHENATLKGEITLISSDEGWNKKVSELLTAGKALLSMGGNKDTSSLLDSLTIVKEKDGTKLLFAIPEEALKNMKNFQPPQGIPGIFQEKPDSVPPPPPLPEKGVQRGEL